jgi:hypothetical protein
VIQEYFEALKAELDTVSGGDFPVELSARFLHRHDAPPRVVLVPMQGNWTEPSISTIEDEDSDDGLIAGQISDTSFDRKVNILHYILEADLQKAEALLEQIAGVIQRIAGGRIESLFEDWTVGQRDQLVTKGEVVTLHVTLKTTLRDSDADAKTIFADVITRCATLPNP